MSSLSREDELLIVLAEECGEATQVASKIIRFGNSERNTENLTQELGDLQCMINMAVHYGLINEYDLRIATENKRIKLQRYSTHLNNMPGEK